MSTTEGSMRPLEMVSETAVPKAKAATKLKNAAQMTAAVGVSTRVETIVAIELAASWNPLRKSNTSATKMMKMTSQRNAPTAGAVEGAEVAAPRKKFMVGIVQR